MTGHTPNPGNRHNRSLIVLVALAVILSFLLFPFSLAVVGPTLIGVGIVGIVAFRRTGTQRVKRLSAASVVVGVCFLILGSNVFLTAAGIEPRRGVDVHDAPRPPERQSSPVG